MRREEVAAVTRVLLRPGLLLVRELRGPKVRYVCTYPRPSKRALQSFSLLSVLSRGRGVGKRALRPGQFNLRPTDPPSPLLPTTVFCGAIMCSVWTVRCCGSVACHARNFRPSRRPPAIVFWLGECDPHLPRVCCAHKHTPQSVTRAGPDSGRGTLVCIA